MMVPTIIWGCSHTNIILISLGQNAYYRSTIMFRQEVAKFHGELALYIGSVIVFIIAFAKFLHNTHMVTSPNTIIEYYNKVIQGLRKSNIHFGSSFYFFCYCSKHEMFQKSFSHLEFQSSSLPIIHAMKFDISFLVKKISIKDFIRISQNHEKNLSEIVKNRVMLLSSNMDSLCLLFYTTINHANPWISSHFETLSNFLFCFVCLFWG